MLFWILADNEIHREVTKFVVAGHILYIGLPFE